MKKPKLKKVSLLLSDDYHRLTFREVMAEITITQELDGPHITMPTHQADAFEKAIQEQRNKDGDGWVFGEPQLVQVLMAYQDGMSNAPSIYNVELVEQREQAA